MIAPMCMSCRIDRAFMSVFAPTLVSLLGNAYHVAGQARGVLDTFDEKGQFAKAFLNVHKRQGEPPKAGPKQAKGKGA